MGLSGRIPRRVDSVTKADLLELIDRAVKDSWTHRGACQTLELPERRAWRWRTRRSADRLDDRPTGGNPVHGLLAWEQDEIVALFNEWGEVDRCHRTLAHRGSYLHRVWVCPSSVRRVWLLSRHTPRRYSAPCGSSAWGPPCRGLPRRRYRGVPSHVPRDSRRPGSRRLHAGHRLANTRAPARLIPGQK